MTEFTLTESGYQCEYCDEWVADSHECDHSPEREHIFRSIEDGQEKIVTAASVNDSWEKLQERVANPIKWLYFGRVTERCEKVQEVASDYTRRTGNSFE